jgi:hypothetical protein
LEEKTRVCFRDNLRVVLRQLDFEVEVYNDLPYKEIERILEQASMEDHSDADCVFVTGLKKAGSFSVSCKKDLSSVADPGCLSRIPDPDFYPSHPKTAIKESGEKN